MSEKWAWQGLYRDGKPVLYANGPAGKRRLVRGESDLRPEDARLIAAAPEMLAVLEAVVQFDKTGSVYENPADAARALIAIVKGTP